jgi:anti-anti-sigma factor
LEQPDPFRIEVAGTTAAAVVTLHGELDLFTAIEAEAVIDSVTAGSRSVTVDLRGLTFMDSSGVAMLVKVDALSRQDGFEFFIVKGSDLVHRVLEICGLDGHLRTLDAPQQWPESERPVERAIIATDLGGTVTRWNAEAERLYGWTAEEVMGKPITNLTVGPQDQDVAEEIMESVRRDGRWEGDFDVRRKDGTQFRAFVRDTLMHDRDGNPMGLLGVSVDSARLVSLA